MDGAEPLPDLMPTYHHRGSTCGLFIDNDQVIIHCSVIHRNVFETTQIKLQSASRAYESIVDAKLYCLPHKPNKHQPDDFHDDVQQGNNHLGWLLPCCTSSWKLETIKKWIYIYIYIYVCVSFGHQLTRLTRTMGCQSPISWEKNICLVLC